MFHLIFCTIAVTEVIAEIHPGHSAQHTTTLWRRHGSTAEKDLSASLIEKSSVAKRHRKKKPNMTELHNEVTEYVGKIGIGTEANGEDPVAEVRVVFDTGSTNLWAASALCTQSPCVDKGRSRFDSAKSVTFMTPPIGDKPLDIKFGTGELKGRLGMDSFQFGPFKVKNQTFAQIEEERGAVFTEIPFEGILGLAFPSMSAQHVTPFFDSVIQQGVLMKNEFAFYLNQHDDRPSALLWGGVDPALYVDKIEMFPVTQPHYWAIELVDFKIGNQSYRFFNSSYWSGASLDDSGDGEEGPTRASLVDDGEAEEGPTRASLAERGSYFQEQKHVKKLIVDSGTTYFTAPTGLKAVIADRLPNAKCSEVEKDRETYPDLTFVLRNKEEELIELQVGQVTYMVEETPGNCALGFMEINVKERFGPAMILGELFMRHHFTVFSRGSTDADARIGFAKAKFGAIPTALQEEVKAAGVEVQSKRVDISPHNAVEAQQSPLERIMDAVWLEGGSTSPPADLSQKSVAVSQKAEPQPLMRRDHSRRRMNPSVPTTPPPAEEADAIDMGASLIESAESATATLASAAQTIPSNLWQEVTAPLDAGDEPMVVIQKGDI